MPKSLFETIQHWLPVWKKQISGPEINTNTSADKVLSECNGMAVIDDRPEGWSDRDLEMFCRGYIQGHRIQVGNVVNALEHFLEVTESN